MSHGKTDELSFGGEREPRLQTWAAAHRRLLVVTVATTVVLAGLGTGGWHLYRQSLLPSPPPDVAFPPAVGFVVQLCLRENIGCRAGTIEQTADLVRGIPEVTSSRVVPHEEIMAQISEISLTGEDPTENGQGAWPPQIEGEFHRTEDFEAVRRRLTGEPGVAGVYRRAGNFWKGRADLRVDLCGSTSAFTTCRNGARTDAQRDAVVAWLREQRGVEKVFFQDRPFGLRLIKHYQPELYLTINDVSEKLYVRLDDPADARVVGRMALGMPGVESANLIK